RSPRRAPPIARPNAPRPRRGGARAPRGSRDVRTCLASNDKTLSPTNLPGLDAPRHSAPMVQSPAVPVPEVRNIRFPLEDIPRYWHGERRSLTLFMNGLSLFFPEGERFFVRSVKRYRDRVVDEALARDVTAFTGQEGIHAREHERYNEML